MTPARILKLSEAADGWYELCLEAGRLAGELEPGQALVVHHHPGTKPARPAVRNASALTGWVDVLFFGDDPAHRWLTTLTAGDELHADGPVGRPIHLPEDTSQLVAIGQDAPGIALTFLLERFRQQSDQAIAFFEWTASMPFRPRPSRFMIPGMPPHVIAADPLLESWSIPSRLAAGTPRPGCHEGSATELLGDWLDATAGQARRGTVVVSAGPATLAREVERLCQANGVVHIHHPDPL